MGEAIAILIFFLVVVVIIVALIVAVIRWLLRINEIVELLKNIHSSIKPNCDKQLQICEGCDGHFKEEQLTQIASGQHLCPECIDNLHTKVVNSSKIVEHHL